MATSIFKRTQFLDLAIFACLFLSLGFDQSLAYGQSVGFEGVALVSTCLLVAVLLSALVGKLLFARWSWSKIRSSQYVFFVGTLAMTSNHLIQSYASFSLNMGEDLVTAKIEYFCHHKFDQAECVRQVNLCPACVQHVDKWMREQMAERLKTYRGRYPAQVPPGQ